MLRCQAGGAARFGRRPPGRWRSEGVLSATEGARRTGLWFCFGRSLAWVALRNFFRGAAPEPEFVHRGSLPVIRHGAQSPLLAIFALETEPTTLEAGAHHGSLSSCNRRRHAPHFPFFSVRRFEVYVWHSYLCVETKGVMSNIDYSRAGQVPSIASDESVQMIARRSSPLRAHLVAYVHPLEDP